VTIAISLKVNDGVVLASDSATTVVGRPPGARAPEILNIYNHANKIFNLHKGSPIGAITWGAGSIGPASISTLMKDLREQMALPGQAWHVDWSQYSVLSIANNVRAFFLEKYNAAFAEWPSKPALGFIVAGYGSGSEMAEEYEIDFAEGSGQCTDPRQLRPTTESGLTWSGEPEAITRLVMGYGTSLPDVLSQNFGLTIDQLQPAMDVIGGALQAPLVLPPMPIQDAIELAEFLVDATIKYTRFAIGGPTVGGPIEVAAITKHEGFKWVRRKHYYNDTLNPLEIRESR
jgi:hypothetical protein